MTTYEIKQLQQQNARLRETLVRLRDLSAHDKHEYQKLLKDIDQKKSEIVELGKTKEKLSTRVEQMEQQIADLQEQVSNSEIISVIVILKHILPGQENIKLYWLYNLVLLYQLFLYFDIISILNQKVFGKMLWLWIFKNI